MCPWTFRKEASREEASPCPAPCPEGEQTPSPFLTQRYAVWPSPRLLFAFSSSDFFFPAHVRAPHSNLQPLLSCLCVKQPPQAALLETGRWCCWADSEQNSVFLALHCMRPPKVCVGVTRASVSQQRSNPGCQGARYQAVLHWTTYVPYTVARDKCVSKTPCNCSSIQICSNTFYVSLKVSTDFKETFPASPSPGMPALSCRLRGCVAAR